MNEIKKGNERKRKRKRRGKWKKKKNEQSPLFSHFFQFHPHIFFSFLIIFYFGLISKKFSIELER